MDCIFCKIVSGELPSYKVYEDSDILAFLDIMPVNPGHVLVIPKKHFINIEDTPVEELAKIMNGVKIIGGIIKDRLDYQGYNIGINNDPVSGQIISHLHIHVIPRKEDDGLELWRQSKYDEGEAEAILKKMTV